MKSIAFLAIFALALLATGCSGAAGGSDLPVSNASAAGGSSSVGARPGTDGVPVVPAGAVKRSSEGAGGSRPSSGG